MIDVTDARKKELLSLAGNSAIQRVTDGKIAKQFALNWTVAEANVRIKNERKQKGWSEKRIQRKARARFVFRTGWDVLSGVMPQVFDGALVEFGDYLEGMSDDIIEKLNEGSV